MGAAKRSYMEVSEVMGVPQVIIQVIADDQWENQWFGVPIF
jgi:hypothetical protein